MAQTQKTKQKSGRAQEGDVEETASDVTNEELAQKTADTLESIEEALDAQLDEELLADIDDILEKDAEEFVNSYVQQGGE